MLVMWVKIENEREQLIWWWEFIKSNQSVHTQETEWAPGNPKTINEFSRLYNWFDITMKITDEITDDD